MNHVAVAKEVLAIARMLSGRVNQKGYKFWVVADGKIESGWEFAEDAKDQLSNLPSGKAAKVYQRAGLRKINLDPDNDSHWMTTGHKARSATKGIDVRLE